MQHISLNILLVHPSYTTSSSKPISRLTTICCTIYQCNCSDPFLLQDLQFHSDWTVEDTTKSQHLNETIKVCQQ